MPHWISETIYAIVSYVPALFVPQDSAHFVLIRGMFGLLLIVLLVWIIAMRPLRSVIQHYKRSRRSTSRPPDP
jgi:hypothetical protein